MTEFTSMATLQSEMVDCRMLHLELEFYELTHQQLKWLAQLCFDGTRELTDKAFYLDWNWSDRRINAETIPEQIHKAKSACDFSFEGDAFSDVVYNSRTYKQYDRQLLYDISTPWKAQCIPVDYPEAYAELFSKKGSAEDIKQALLKLFSFEKRKFIGLWRKHDLSGGLFSCPYDNMPEKYHGQFKFSIAVQCLGKCANAYSNQLAQFACKISDSLLNISARIALSPISIASPCSAHMKYFGNISGTTWRKSGYGRTEWFPYYFLQGAEWFNIISPLQQEHLSGIHEEIDNYSDISIEMLSSGGLVVRSTKGIMEADVPEYLSLKRLLYNALYPGRSEMSITCLYDPDDYSFRAKPRNTWEYVPMLSEEIIVLPDRILFCHGGQNSTE